MVDHNVRGFRRDLRRFERQLDFLQSKLDCCRKVTLAQCHALLEISDSESTSVNDLAKTLELNKSTVSRTVENLVKKKLVRRVPSLSDRRFVALVLTDLGRKLCAAIHAENDQMFSQKLSRLSLDQRNSIFVQFRLLVDALSNEP